jgi:hypothetical protein
MKPTKLRPIHEADVKAGAIVTKEIEANMINEIIAADEAIVINEVFAVNEAILDDAANEAIVVDADGGGSWLS